MDREKVIEGVHDARRYLEDREWVDRSVGVHIDALNDAISLLKEQDNCENCAIAIEDRQPIVRCKDCKKRYKKSCGYFYADGRIMCDDWFCADGERR